MEQLPQKEYLSKSLQSGNKGDRVKMRQDLQKSSVIWRGT